jgi:hypothetical protein
MRFNDIDHYPFKQPSLSPQNTTIHPTLNRIIFMASYILSPCSDLSMSILSLFGTRLEMIARQHILRHFRSN